MEVKYIDMQGFIADSLNWQHPDFPVVARVFGHEGYKKNGEEIPAGYWEIDERFIKTKIDINKK